MRREQAIEDLLVFTEHEHVYTIGKGGDSNHLLASEAELASGGIDLFQIDRGGDITYHGPGQVVGYPILDLNAYKTDLHWYLRSLEEVIIRTLGRYGITGVREDGMTGVWVEGEKIAAIGVKVSRWITMHGFALNVNTDLGKFARIIPCGIFHKGVTSIERRIHRRLGLRDVHRSLLEEFGNVFGCRVKMLEPAGLREILRRRELENV